MDDATRTRFYLVTGPHRIPVDVELGWRAADPLAVHIVFLDRPGGVQWLVGRDLLTAGLLRPAGEGDVRITPPNAGQRMRIWIRGGDDSTATFEVPDWACIAGLLNRTDRPCAAALAAAHANLDELAALLADGSEHRGGRS